MRGTLCPGLRLPGQRPVRSQVKDIEKDRVNVHDSDMTGVRFVTSRQHYFRM